MHYHGTPLSPRAELFKLAGKHFCVPFADPRDADWCLANAQSVMWDSGAFTAHTQGKQVDWQKYYAWLEPRLGHPHWAIVPDVIDGTIDDQKAMVAQWPHGIMLGAPVWHMGLEVSYLLDLVQVWPRVCFGSSRQYWQVGSDLWSRRTDESTAKCGRQCWPPHLSPRRAIMADKLTELPYRKAYISRRPSVFWYVHGRKMFCLSIPERIRASWKVGVYPLGRAALEDKP